MQRIIKVKIAYSMEKICLLNELFSQLNGYQIIIYHPKIYWSRTIFFVSTNESAFN